MSLTLDERAAIQSVAVTAAAALTQWEKQNRGYPDRLLVSATDWPCRPGLMIGQKLWGHRVKIVEGQTPGTVEVR